MILTSTSFQIRANENQQKLQAISELEDNWDGYGASKISSDVIFKTKEILKSLYKQPEFFPTGAGTIQMEYETDDGDYLEFQIGDMPEIAKLFALFTNAVIFSEYSQFKFFIKSCIL